MEMLPGAGAGPEREEGVSGTVSGLPGHLPPAPRCLTAQTAHHPILSSPAALPASTRYPRHLCHRVRLLCLYPSLFPPSPEASTGQ